jgi:hypothetical protein
MFLPETELMIARDRIEQSVREAQYNIDKKVSKPAKKAQAAERKMNFAWLRTMITKAAV